MAAERGTSSPWYLRTISAAEDTMAYECDTRLGSPTVDDCSQIQWDQVKPGGDSLAVQPGKGVFLHQSMYICFAVFGEGGRLSGIRICFDEL